jgi:hypothetical protein
MTNIKSNLKRHCVTKHSQVIKPAILIGENVANFTENTTLNYENTTLTNENTTLTNENTTFDNENATFQNSILSNELQCNNCNKIFKNKQNLKYHLNICKGKVNRLECHICHQYFASSASKSRHIKSCQTKAMVPINTVNTPTTNYNISGDNNTINNNNINNNINNTYNIIVYKPNGNDTMEFNTDHITHNDFKSLFIDNPSEKELVENYARQLLSNPMNQCIKKTNMRSIHSQVHVGNNNWHTRHDKDIYPKLVCDVAQTFDEFIKQKTTEDNLIISKRMVKEMERFLDYMSDKGYCNDEILGKEMDYTFKALVYSIKAITFDSTKTK